MSPGITSVHLPLSSIGTMAFRESRVEDTIHSTLGDAVDQGSMNLPIYEDIKLLMDKDIKMKWQQCHNKKHHQK